MQTLSVGRLREKAQALRKDIIEMTAAAGSGHPGGSLSSTELLTALYFHVLKHRPDDPDWDGRDRFVLSKGHIAPGLYAALAEAGYFPKKEILTLRKMGSRLQGHPHMLKLPGLETSSGSLGQGLSIAIGMALGFRLDGKTNRTYCLMGDGETNEGQIWEAAMTAGHYQLDTLCGMVDVNGLQIDGFTKDVKNLEPFRLKWASFGWHTIEIDGHDMQAVLDAFEEAASTKGKPSVILANTIKGKGVSFMENQAGWHGKATQGNETEKALKDIEACYGFGGEQHD
ncbi:MAG: transketolase [archaeon]